MLRYSECDVYTLDFEVGCELLSYAAKLISLPTVSCIWTMWRIIFTF